MSSQRKITAWLEQVHSGQAQTDKARIYRALEKCERTLDHFREFGWKHQTVTARLSDLMDEGLVGETSDGWFYIVPEHNRERLRMERLTEKKERIERQLELVNRAIEEAVAEA